MYLYKFQSGDILYNRIKTYPRCSFFIYDGTIYYNNQVLDSGAYANPVTNVPSGHISLYEINIDRESTLNPYIYPFVTKNGSGDALSTVSKTAYNNTFAYGDVISGSYPFSSSIAREYYQSTVTTRTRAQALKTTLNHYTPMSDHYAYSSSLGDKGSQGLGLISVPSIFYGSSIRKGSVSLKFYVTGTLVAEVADTNQNGELIQVSGSVYAQAQGSGKVAGVVLYNEGFVVLTGSWPLELTSRDYINDLTNLQTSSWQFFGAGGNDGINPRADASLSSASFDMSFEGTNYVSTVTMHAHAQKGMLNHSNNPTYVKNTQANSRSKGSVTGSSFYVEDKEIELANTVSSSYLDPTSSFSKQTFISKIGIYDEDENLIGIASLSTPVKKTEERDLTFKLKYDI